LPLFPSNSPGYGSFDALRVNPAHAITSILSVEQLYGKCLFTGYIDSANASNARREALHSFILAVDIEDETPPGPTGGIFGMQDDVFHFQAHP
jgi:hypothetical protein